MQCVPGHDGSGLPDVATHSIIIDLWGCLGCPGFVVKTTSEGNVERSRAARQLLWGGSFPVAGWGLPLRDSGPSSVCGPWQGSGYVFT